MPVVDDYFDRASRAYEIAKPWAVASGTASSSKANDVFNVSRSNAVLGHVSTSDFMKPTPDAPVGMGFSPFGKASRAYELAKPWEAVASGTTSSSKTIGVYNASRTDTVLGHLDTRSLRNPTCTPAGVERCTYLPPYHGVIKEQSVGLAIEKFSGDIMCYLEFKRKFAKYVENVHQDCDVCLSHLESLCVGEAHRAIKGLTLHPNRKYAYRTAWERLDQRFGDYNRLMERVRNDLLEGPPIKEWDVVALTALCDKMFNCENVFASWGRENDLNSPDVIKSLFLRLPYRLKSEFVAVSRRNNNQRTFRDMRSLVDTAVHDAQTSFGQLLYQTKMPKVQSNKVINPGFKGQSRQAMVNATLNPTSSCSSLCKCCNLSHRLWKCKKFIGYSYVDRLEFVRKKGLCFNCLVYGIMLGIAS